MNIGTVYGGALALLIGATLLIAARDTDATLPLVGAGALLAGDL
jgi:hypothetical protein